MQNRLLGVAGCLVVGWSTVLGQGAVLSEPFSFGRPSLQMSVTSTRTPIPLEAGDSARVEVTIENRGTGPARQVDLSFVGEAPPAWLQVEDSRRLGDIAPGARVTARLRLLASREAPSQTLRLNVEARSSVSNSTLATAMVDVATSEALPLQLSLVLADSAITVTPGKTSVIGVRLKNLGPGSARQLEISIGEPATSAQRGLRYVSPQRTFQIGDLQAGGSISFGFKVQADDTLSGLAARIVTTAKDARGNTYPPLVLLVPIDRAAGGLDARIAGLYERGEYARLIELCTPARQQGAYLSPKALYMFGMALAFSNSPREAVAAMEASAAGGGAEAATWLQKNTVVRSQTTVHYVAAGQPIVAGGVVKIGMLGIEDSKGNLSAVTERLATAIGQRSTHFAVVPYATLDKQKSRFGVRQLDPSKQEVLTALARAFDIKFVVSGLVSGSQRLRLTVTQTTPYRILHTQEYQNSSTSTAVEDALLYFTKGVVPVYALEDRREMRR